MRFISKNSNLRVVLSPGLPAEPLAGRLAVPGINVKFLNGVADVSDADMISKMLAHPGFNSDFISAEDIHGEFKDPYAQFREEMEPAHVISEVKYGQLEKSIATPKKLKVPPEIESLLNSKALEIARALLPEMIKETLAGLAGASKEASVKTAESQLSSSEVAPVSETQPGSSDPLVPQAKRRGRPPNKPKVEEIVA